MQNRSIQEARSFAVSRAGEISTHRRRMVGQMNGWFEGRTRMKHRVDTDTYETTKLAENTVQPKVHSVPTSVTVMRRLLCGSKNHRPTESGKREWPSLSLSLLLETRTEQGRNTGSNNNAGNLTFWRLNSPHQFSQDRIVGETRFLFSTFPHEATEQGLTEWGLRGK